MAYPLETIDSVRTDDGKFDTESALYLIANGVILFKFQI